MAYTPRAIWSKLYHTLRVGRKAYLDADHSGRPQDSRALAAGHSVRTGREAYVDEAGDTSDLLTQDGGFLLLQDGGRILIRTA